MNDIYEKRGYLQEEFRLFHLKDSVGSTVDFHYHEFHKLLILHSGSGGYVVDGKRYHLEPGDVVLIGSQCVHRPEFPKGMVYERSIYYIDPDFIGKHDTIDCDLTGVFFHDNHVFRGSIADSTRLQHMSLELERELDEKAFGYEIVSQNLLLRLLVEIGRIRAKDNSTMPAPDTAKNSRIQAVLAYVDEHLTEELDIDTIAEAFFVSRYHLMRSFKAQVGEGLHSYINRRRLLYARELIGQGITVTDACFQCGFKSYSSFARAYGKLFGCTPTGRREVVAMEELDE